jgi:hypothetical protein
LQWLRGDFAKKAGFAGAGTPVWFQFYSENIPS